jgi:Superfamily I DNA and RNA helicases
MRPASTAFAGLPGGPDRRLARNYRSTGTIVSASSQVIAPRPNEPVAEIVRDMHERIAIQVAATERAEAESVVKSIEHMIGGHTFFSIDSGRAAPGPQASRSFADFAVLYRTDAQSAALREALDRSGIPYQKHSHTALAEEPAVRALLQELGDGSGATMLADDLTRRPNGWGNAATRAGRDRRHGVAAPHGARRTVRPRARALRGRRPR